MTAIESTTATMHHPEPQYLADDKDCEDRRGRWRGIAEPSDVCLAE